MSESQTSSKSLLDARPHRRASKGSEEFCGISINESCPEHPVLYRDGPTSCANASACRMKEDFLKHPDVLKRCRFGKRS